MIGLAAANRFIFTRDLAGGSGESATRLRGSIALETALGLAAVLAAGQLGITPPAIHIQP
jgi:putative copper export protein